MLKSNKGITLVALVITIIVLLILAGVTLSIVLHTGIIDNSQRAVNSWNEAAKNEWDQEEFFYHIYQNYIDNNTKTSTGV